MRLSILGWFLLCVAGCAAGPSAKVAANGPARRCSVSSCFNQKNVRDFDVLDAHTLVVYEGRQRCPFLVTLRGPNCGLGIGPSLVFLSPRRVNRNATDAVSRILMGGDPFPPSATSPFGVSPRSSGEYFETPSRVCSLTSNVIAYTGAMAPGGEMPIDAIAGLSRACVLDRVRSMTDNQLIGLLVKRKFVPPPPPIGPGSLSVPKSAPAPTPSGGSAAAGGKQQEAPQQASSGAQGGNASDSNKDGEAPAQ